MTRIVAGTAKGRTLRVPSEGTRPTSAKVREALFSKLRSWGLLEDVRVLDLFAGSGALGLEAFSRGAAGVDLVEKSRQAQRVIERNIRETGGTGTVRLCKCSAEQFLERPSIPYSVIFVDPPYAWDGQRLTDILTKTARHLDEDGVIVVERDSRSEPPVLPPGMILEEQRRWGDTAVYILGLPAPSQGEVELSK